MLTKESESEQKQHTQALQNVEEKNRNFRERLEARIRELAEEVGDAQERVRYRPFIFADSFSVLCNAGDRE